jgi:hypothetical protein
MFAGVELESEGKTHKCTATLGIKHLLFRFWKGKKINKEKSRHRFPASNF